MRLSRLCLIGVLLLAFPAMAEDIRGSLTVQGVERSYLLHTPPSGTDWPLVINFHGINCTPQNQREWSKFDRLADRKHFAVVYPAGRNRSWNGVGDLVFVNALLDTLMERYPVDPKRVYATGFSAGGFMAHGTALALSERIAAIASVAGYLPFGVINPLPKPTRPVPVMLVHNKQDRSVPYAGVRPTIDTWVRYDQCPAQAETARFNEHITIERHGPGKNKSEVVAYTLDLDILDGHFWPWPEGGGIETAEEIWKFLSRFALDEAPARDVPPVLRKLMRK